MMDNCLLVFLFLIVSFVALCFGIYSAISSFLTPVIIIAAAFLLSAKTKNDSEKSAHYKRSIAIIVIGILLLVMGISDNARGSYYGAYGNIVIGSDPTWVVVGCIFLLVGIIHTAFGYMTYGKSGRLTEKEYLQHKKKLITSFFIGVILLLAVGAGGILSNTITVDSDDLKVYQEEIIGKTYSDMKQDVALVGDKIEKKSITIIDDETLEFTFSKGTLTKRLDISPVNRERYTEIYTYKLKRNLTGRIAIYFNGRGHIAYFDENTGSITGFKLY